MGKVKTVECQPGPLKKVCKKEPQPDTRCLDVPKQPPPGQDCLDRVEEICQDMASELCKVDICKTEVRLMCEIEVETKCRLIEGSSPEGSEKCAGLQAQGIDCHPLVGPVPADDEGDEGVEVWETCEEVPLMKSSCIGEVCHDIPVTGRQCDGFDLENCKEVAVNELKCWQVSTEECQALWDEGGDCHYVLEGDKHRSRRMAGGLQAFKICEDYPGGEVCKEEEVEVCQPSDDEEDNLCSEVEVNKCIAEMAKECTPEPVCKPIPAVETCEDVPGDDICEEVWTTEETTKKERACEQKVLCCGEPCPVEKKEESILKKIKPWKESILRKTKPWKESILKKTNSWKESILENTKAWQETILKKTKPWQIRHREVHGSRHSKTL